MIQLLPSVLLFEKSKKLPEGTVRNWKGRDYKKVNGKWIKQKKDNKEGKVNLTVNKKEIKDIDKQLSIHQHTAINKLAFSDPSDYKVVKVKPSFVIVEFESGDRYRIEKDGRIKQTVSASGNYHSTKLHRKDQNKPLNKYLDKQDKKEIVDKETSNAIMKVYNDIKDMPELQDVTLNDLAYAVNQELTDPIALKKVRAVLRSKLQKSIPTIQNEKQDIVKEEIKQKKVIPQDVKNFIKKIEESFKIIDASVADLCKQCGIEKCADILASYKKFKSDYEYQINDAINYPKSSKGSNEVVDIDKRSDYESSRVRLSKLTI